MNSFDLTHLHILRPEKVDWWFSNPLDILGNLKSKGLKDFVKHIDEVLTINNLHYTYQPINSAAYQEWLAFYEVQMRDQAYDVIAKPEWFSEKSQQGFVVEGLFMYQKDKLVGTGIFTRHDKLESHFNFKASIRLKLSGHSNSSLGACLDYLYLQIMSDQGIQKISGGRSRNAFGVVNSLGHLDYKLKFGYIPTPTPDLPLHSRVPLNEAGNVVFLGKADCQWSMYGVHSSLHPQPFEVARFSTANLPFRELVY